MKALKLTSLIENGRLQPEQGKKLQVWLGACNGKTVVVTAEIKKKRRSLDQNAYMWTVVIPFVMDIFKDHGTLVDAEDCHTYLKMHVGKLKTLMTDPGGDMKTILRSTASLSTIEFNEYIESIARWAASWGYVLPEPKR